MESELTTDTTRSSWTGGWFSWSRQSDVMLRNIEQKILSCVKTAYKRFYVDIGSVVGQCDKIWTISLNDESTKTPLVLLHGMAAGVALWCPNLDALAATRPVYAIDLLGFGRSSRPKFSTDAAKVEAQWVESVEEWRREVKLKEFILLGHSLGGFIATAYALKYPERVRHLVLADPWGFLEKPSDVYEKYQVSLWVRAVAVAVQPLNPLWAVRAAGPAGRWLVGKVRPDIARKYAGLVPAADQAIPDYIYHCNAQTPSGESAFHTLMDVFAWAKNPMVRRVNQLDPTLPITVLYGSRTWLDRSTAQLLTEHRTASKTYVQVINGAGHHLYVDKPEQFNKFVLEACTRADNEPRPSASTTENTTQPTKSATTPTENTAQPTKSTTTPTEKITHPTETSTTPTENTSNPTTNPTPIP